MEAQANTTREQSNTKSMEVGDPRMAKMEEQEKKDKLVVKVVVKVQDCQLNYNVIAIQNDTNKHE